jgi:hypothetical protein
MTEPIPAVAPLAYYDDSRDPWRIVARLMAIVAIAQGGLGLLGVASDLLDLWSGDLFNFFPPFGKAWSYVFVGSSFIAAALLVAAGILALQFQRTGYKLIVVGSVATIVTAFVELGLSALSLRGMRIANPGISTLDFVSLVVSTIRDLLLQSLLPIVLWILFRRREMRNLFQGN